MQQLFILLAFFFTVGTPATYAQQQHDPSADIRVTELKNGLRVIYAPSENAKTVQVRIRVDAGRWTEETAGVAHLLEHYIFKDAKMDRDMTYLEVIKENGGSGNAYVDDESTTYYATVPPGKAEWLLNVFGKMIVNKQFVAEEVEHAKKPVYLEIGEANPFHYFIAFVNKVMPGNLNLYPSFWETEFGMEKPNRAPVPDQITTAGLTSADIKAFYDKYYHAKNMTLFIAGDFNLPSMRTQVENAFAALPAGLAKGYKAADLKPRIRPYKRSNSTSGTPSFEIGTKLADVTLEETMVLHVYMGHLAHRLMKELRNSRGETYTVRPNVEIRHKNGFASLQMEAPKEAFYTNFDFVRDYLQREASNGEINEDLFNEAIQLYGHKFKLTDKDSATMMALAQSADSYRQEYGETVKTPFQIFSALTIEDYRGTLKKIFTPQMELERTAEPPLIFRYEEFVLTLLGIIAWSAMVRKIFARPFNHSEIRWVRKFKYPPAYAVQIGMTASALLVCALVGALLYHLWMLTPYVHSSFIVSDYLFGQLSLAFLYLACQAWLMNAPRKVMVVGNELWIKSLGYSSSTVPLKDIEAVELANPVSVLLNPKAMWRIKYRFYTFNLAFWQPGLLVKISNGQHYFMGLTRPREAAVELKSFIKTAAKPDGQAAHPAA